VVVGAFAFQGPLLNYGFQEGKVYIIQFAQKAGISISKLDAKTLSLSGSDTITFWLFFYKDGSFQQKIVGLKPSGK
jgi:hypothetical protein